MTEIHFGLKIPEQNPDLQDGLDIRPKTVEAWIKALPMADTGVTVQQIYSSLAEVNRNPLSSKDRFKFMEQMRESIFYCIHSLKKNFIGQSFPLSPKSQRFTEKTFALLTEASNGYKAVIVALLSESRVDRKILAYCVHRTLHLLGNILLTSYQLYTPAPQGLWQELHRLFHLAESGDILDIAIKDAENKISKLNSINKMYKQIILLDVSNPYHLRNGEAKNIYTALDQWAQYTEIFSSETIPKEHNLFVCILNTDRAPKHLNVSGQADNKYNRYIDLTHLNAMLRREIARHEESDIGTTIKKPGNSKQPLANDLLRRLLITWKNRNKRGLSRFSSDKPINISIGLNSTHHMLKKNDPIKSKNDDAEIIEAGQPDIQGDPTIKNPTDFHIEPVSEVHEYTAPQMQTSSSPIVNNMDKLEKSTEPASLEPSYAEQTWKTQNVSAGGYCLLWDSNKSSNIHVGEMIGLREINEESPFAWSIGVVRWMQYVPDKGLKLGIQILSTDAEAISSCIIQPNLEGNSKTYNCLGLPGAKLINQSPTLLTPALHYKAGDSLVINQHDDTLHHVQLTKLLENTGNFSRFQYIPLATQDTAFGINLKKHQNKKP